MKSAHVILFITTTLLIGCNNFLPENYVKTNINNSHAINAIDHKRINTTDCKDADDWYLDGYRVGKSFSTQKKEMLDQRLGFCHLTSKKLPKKFRTNWEKGFSVGSRG
ncbi:hypothetical protein [Otariodibacter oris]|uniref:Lipoprotein n=1 Tax=Otariodibacter oris TaxID=1032623 RepID=A0A420XIS5_9PAST|nr:hypothetical protein [Otariodibacter oris]QGM80620.1 hypothetical protein A6A10_03990 [Otariodibacter oris]RKR77222.1 hypothetical protein DES31_0547 [Otariodibacter oris]